MKIDTTDYYPITPGSSCEDPEPESVEKEKEAPAPEPLRPWERKVDAAAHLLSWVLVPLLMPLYALMICFHISVLQFASLQTKWSFCLIVFCITAVIPMMVILLLKKLGVIEDVGLNGRKERLIPYIISILTLGASGWFMLAKGAPLWAGMFFFGGALAAVINLIVNFWWKISAHAAAAAGVVALLVCISREAMPHPHIEVWVAVAIGIAGLLGAARVWLGRHTVLQVLAGSAVGFLSVFFLTLI